VHPWHGLTEHTQGGLCISLPSENHKKKEKEEMDTLAKQTSQAISADVMWHHWITA
jgi:DNA-binding IclR family transcriptional regulator